MGIEINKNTAVLAILIIILIISIILFVAPENTINPDDLKKYTHHYEEITPMQMENMYVKDNFLVIDCTEPKTVYREAHLPNAVWSPNPSLFFGQKNDIVVYNSNNEDTAISFCENLSGNVHGKIYYMKGGINAWLMR